MATRRSSLISKLGIKGTNQSISGSQRCSKRGTPRNTAAPNPFFMIFIDYKTRGIVSQSAPPEPALQGDYSGRPFSSLLKELRVSVDIPSKRGAQRPTL